MKVVLALVILVALIGVTSVLGAVLRSRSGRARAVSAPWLSAEDLGSLTQFGERGTIIQFSSSFCAPCAETHRLIHTVIAEASGITYFDIDVADHPTLANRFNVMQTPTTLLIDGEGILRARVGGAPRKSEFLDAVHTTFGSANVHA